MSAVPLDCLETRVVVQFGCFALLLFVFCGFVWFRCFVFLYGCFVVWFFLPVWLGLLPRYMFHAVGGFGLLVFFL